MLERVYYLFITSFIPVDWLVPVLAGILMILLLIYHIIGKPFTAKSENILEIFGRIVNMCSLAIGITLRYANLSNNLKNYFLSPLLIVLSLLYLLSFIFLVIANHIQKKKYINNEDNEYSENERDFNRSFSLDAINEENNEENLIENSENENSENENSENENNDSDNSDNDMLSSLLTLGIGNRYRRKDSMFLKSSPHSFEESFKNLKTIGDDQLDSSSST